MKQACDEANKIQEEADALIEEGNIMEAYYKYRAFYWIMREVLEKCPASYKPVAKESVKYAKSMVEYLHTELMSQKQGETNSGGLTQVVGQDEVGGKIVKLLKRS